MSPRSRVGDGRRFEILRPYDDEFGFASRAFDVSDYITDEQRRQQVSGRRLRPAIYL